MQQQSRVWAALRKIFKTTRPGWLYPTHPAIADLITDEELVTVEQTRGNLVDVWAPKYPAASIVKLALEQPSIPQDKFQQRVSYWRSEEHQARGIRTTVTLGKYIKRHFPTMPDHEIRDHVALYAPTIYEIWETTEQIIKACEEGPYSCMQWGVNNNGPIGDHPYQVYTPELGWKICVGIENGEIVSRALINGNVFIRTYEKTDVPRVTQTSHEMNAWLISQGYEKKESWPWGTAFSAIASTEIESDYIFPYLDGDRVKVSMNMGRFEIESGGMYKCKNDDGTAEESGEPCDECGHHTEEDDLTSVGDSDEPCVVCSHCLQEHYTDAYAENGHSRYIHDKYVVWVEGVPYATEFLSDNDIIETEDGRFAKIDNVVYVEDYGYYHIDSVGDNPNNNNWEVCEIKGDYFLREECAYCEYQEEWIKKSDSVTFEYADTKYTVEEGWEDEMIDWIQRELAEKAGQLVLEV